MLGWFIFKKGTNDEKFRKGRMMRSLVFVCGLALMGMFCAPVRAAVVVEDEFGVAVAGDADIQRANVGDDGRIDAAGVLQVDSPLGGGGVTELDRDAADLQTGLRISVDDRPLGARLVQLFDDCRAPGPVGEEC